MAKKHKHGSMNIEVQENTYGGFISAPIWGGGICIGILIFLALFAA